MAPFRSTVSLVLSVKSKNWRMNDANSEEADNEFQRVRLKVLQRDNFICAGCGFGAKSYQEVHHRDDDHSNNDMKNLVTLCSFCHMCQHIGLAGMNKEAVLIWLPEFSQADVHHIVRSILVAQRDFQRVSADKDSPTKLLRTTRFVSEAATSVMAALKDRMKGAEDYLGSSDPYDIGDAMMKLDDVVYDKRTEFLAGIRLLPLGIRMKDGQNQMDRVVDTWLDPGGPYNGQRPGSWKALRDSLIA